MADPRELLGALFRYEDSDGMAAFLGLQPPAVRRALVSCFWSVVERHPRMSPLVFQLVTALIKAGDHAAAEELLSRTELEARASNDDALLTRTLGTLGALHLAKRDFDGAARANAAAWACARASNDAAAMVRIGTNLGIIASEQRDYPAAIQHFATALATARQAGDVAGTRLAEDNIDVALHRLVLDVATTRSRDHIRDAVQELVARDLQGQVCERVALRTRASTYDADVEGLRLLAVRFLQRTGDALLALGRQPDARTAYELALSVADLVGEPRSRAELLLNLAGLTAMLHGRVAAEGHFAELVAFCRESALPDLAACGSISWGAACEAAQDSAAACVHYGEALRIAEASGLGELLESARAGLQRVSAPAAEDPGAAVPVAAHGPAAAPAPARRTIAGARVSSEPASPRRTDSAVPTDDRHLCVFVSSPFSDMRAERGLLLSRVFPKLRRLCHQRSVTFTGVDLQWGISEGQAAAGETLRYCLRAIDRARPHFVCMLGDRYGSPFRPEDAPGVRAHYPWLVDAGGRSFTELEVMHAVLNDEGPTHAYFYFRETPGGEPAARDGAAGDSEPARLRRLKDAIRARSVTVAEPERAIESLRRSSRTGSPVLRPGYSSPEEFADLVERDLIELVDLEYPEASGPSPADRERLQHDAFARRHLGFHVPDEELLATLDRFLQRPGPPLVLWGERGCGKTAAIANWVRRLRRTVPDVRVIDFHVGATQQSTSPRFMLRYLIGELARTIDPSPELPEDLPGLAHALRDHLFLTSATGPVVLAIDGMSELRDPSDDALWPPALPANVHLILTVSDPGELSALQDRGWATLELRSFDDVASRRAFISAYLARSSKALGASLIDTLAAEPACRNPLYLRIVLDELIAAATHADLDEALAGYLQAKSLTALYDRVLERLEGDHQRGGSAGALRKAMAFLSLERFDGLSETELLELLGWPGDPVPRLTIEPLLDVPESLLVSRQGTLVLANPEACRAAGDRYATVEVVAALTQYRELHPSAALRDLSSHMRRIAEAGADGLDAAAATFVQNVGSSVMRHFDLGAVSARKRSLERKEAAAWKTGDLVELAEALHGQVLLAVQLSDSGLGRSLSDRMLPLEGALEKTVLLEALVAGDGSAARVRDPAMAEAALGSTLGIRGLVYSKMHRHQDALDAYARSAEILRRLAGVNAWARDGLVATLTNQANLMADMGLEASAASCYAEAAELRGGGQAR